MGALVKSDIIKVVAASSSPLVQRGIIAMLYEESDIIVIKQASSTIEIMESIYNDHPDLLIIDAINGTQDTNLNRIEIVHKTFPDVKVLLIIDKHDEHQELKALRLGVRGIISEGVDQSEFIRSIKSVCSGKLWIRQYILEKFIIDLLPQLEFNGGSQQRHCINLLTKRELDIANLVIRGYKNKEIGHKLFVTEKTVKNHLSKIFKKLRVNKRADLRKYRTH